MYKDTGEIYEPLFESYKTPSDYWKGKVVPICPMTAKEEDREEELEIMLAPNSGYYAEEKFDGTRATMHIGKDHTRVFSRRVSKKTDWYVENTDSLPQMRGIVSANLDKTIIDGEMFIPNRPFRDVSSTLNCNWDKSIDRQLELGWVVLHAFDIIFYKGTYVAKMPLWKRKQYLHLVCEELDSPYVEEVRYYDDLIPIFVSSDELEQLNDLKEKYSTLFEEVKYAMNITDYTDYLDLSVSKRAYYEYIVMNGGEGIILKNRNGKYLHKRGREYTKVKKFLTRDVIVIGFSDPEKYYEGKSLPNWEYFDYDGKAVTKYHHNNWIGAIRFGVVVSPLEILQIQKNAPNEKFEIHDMGGLMILYVGETSGMNEEERADFSKNKEDYIGEVIEVKAQEVIQKTGKFRHPRYIRIRTDKNADQCIWKDHIGG